MEILILFSLLVSGADFFRPHGSTHRDIYPQAVGMLLFTAAFGYMNFGVAITVGLSVLVFCLRFLLALPFRLVILVREVDYWKWWCAEQLAQGVAVWLLVWYLKYLV